MKIFLKVALGCALLTGLFAAPAMAAGPVDGEVGAFWWANDFDVSGTSTDAGAPGFRASLWLKERWGFKASQFSSDLGDLGAPDSDYLAVDFMWKAFAPAENNFVAVGLGWEEFDNLGEETSGMRVSVEGRVGIMGQVHAYGEGSYLPSLDDTPTIESVTGMEYELGVGWRAAPFVTVKAAWRATETDFDIVGFNTSESTTSKGFLLGAGFHF